MYTICKGRVYPGSAGQGLIKEDSIYVIDFQPFWKGDNFCDTLFVFLHADFFRKGVYLKAKMKQFAPKQL